MEEGGLIRGTENKAQCHVTGKNPNPNSGSFEIPFYCVFWFDFQSVLQLEFGRSACLFSPFLRRFEHIVLNFLFAKTLTQIGINPGFFYLRPWKRIRFIFELLYSFTSVIYSDITGINPKLAVRRQSLVDLSNIAREDRNSVICEKNYAEVMKVSPLIIPWFEKKYLISFSVIGLYLNYTQHFTEKFDYALLVGRKRFF